MAINLHSKHSKQLVNAYAASSVIDGSLSKDFDFVGARTVKVTTMSPVSENGYTRSGTNRYGNPQEVEDTIQEMTLSQDRSFSAAIDKGNFVDQDYQKKVGAFTKVQFGQVCVPNRDKYCLARLAAGAGKVVANSTALTKATICDRIADGTVALDDAGVPSEGRTLWVSASAYKLLRLSDEFLKVEPLAKRALESGVVGEYDNMKVRKVPSGRWPKFVNFIIAHKDAAIAPVKIDEHKLHVDPPGISGNLIEGRQYYDCFVFGAKCDGVYIEVCTANSNGTVLGAPTITANSGVIAAANADSGVSGKTIKYTTDGTDPRYSFTAKTGTQSDVVTAGTVVKAYVISSAEGVYPSAVATATLT